MVVLQVLLSSLIIKHAVKGSNSVQEIYIGHIDLASLLILLMGKNFKYFLGRTEESNFVFVVPSDFLLTRQFALHLKFIFLFICTC